SRGVRRRPFVGRARYRRQRSGPAARLRRTLVRAVHDQQAARHGSGTRGRQEDRRGTWRQHPRRESARRRCRVHRAPAVRRRQHARGSERLEQRASKSQRFTTKSEEEQSISWWKIKSCYTENTENNGEQGEEQNDDKFNLLFSVF